MIYWRTSRRTHGVSRAASSKVMFPLGVVTEERHADWTIGQYERFQRDRHKREDVYEKSQPRHLANSSSHSDIHM
jgi:hypothetical protein